MEAIRILQVIGQMNHGGIESLLINIYRNIDRKRVQFDFLTFKETRGHFDDEIESLGGKMYYFKRVNIKRILTGVVDRELYNFFLKHQEYKIIHSHMAWSGIILRNANRAKIPVRIAHAHSAYLRVPFGKTAFKNMAKNFIKPSINKYATHRFACSQMAAYWLFGKKTTGEGNVDLWPNAIDYGKFNKCNAESRKKIRSEIGITDQTFVLIHVGRLSLPKNHLFLIDVFDALASKIPDSKLLLVGADDMNGQCQKYASKKRSAENIIFLGVRSDIAELLQAGDMFVFPSFYEGFPVSVLEAQAAGLPCLLSDTVTNEVCLTDNIVQLPINNGADIWVNKILEFKDRTRIDNHDIFLKKGYDICSLCHKLTKFYENVYVR